MSVKRIFSCHPIKFLGASGEGFDPVKKKMKVTINNGNSKNVIAAISLISSAVIVLYSLFFIPEPIIQKIRI